MKNYDKLQLQELKSVKNVREWLDRMDLDEGYTIANAKFKRDYSRLSTALRKQAGLLYVLGVELGNHSLTKMMRSAKKQAEFCRSVWNELNHKKVELFHCKVFEDDVKKIERRLEHIARITKENIRLTEYEPFYNAMGEELYKTDFTEIPKLAKEWNEEHADIVKKHMEEVQPEIDAHKAFIQRKHEITVADREAVKAEKKAEDKYVKELKQNAQKNRAEYKKLERSFERYYSKRA